MQHLNYCPDFLSSFSPGLEQLTREIVRKWNCHFIYFRNLFHFCLILQHHLEKTMLKLCIHNPPYLVNIDCSPNLCCENSMGLPPHLLNQITFEHEIQDTKFYGVSKMKTNSIYYYIVNHFGCFLLCNLEFFLLRHYTYFNAEFSPFLNNLDSCNTK